jgi:hypothetical protein
LKGCRGRKQFWKLDTYESPISTIRRILREDGMTGRTAASEEV